MTPIRDLSKLCIHTITTKPWNIETAIEKYCAAGVNGITVWRQWLENRDPYKIGQEIIKSGLTPVSLCRGGFFPASSLTDRQKAIDDNRRAIDEAAALGTLMIVLVCGADPRQSLEESRRHIFEGIAAVLPDCEDRKIRLAVEPLHPMYADSRSAINTLKQANDLCDDLDHPLVGVAADVYHLWWDPDLQNEIRRCGESGYLWAFHICDWRTPTVDLLNDRGLMGEGCIDIPQIREWVEQAGFEGFHEVEIFSNRWWQADQDEFLKAIIQAYRTEC
ncbi:TIM barrel protein [candidate division KSB1 bacterium]|nr:TIM barrel protein [candidate division KSB1 bacterium]